VASRKRDIVGLVEDRAGADEEARQPGGPPDPGPTRSDAVEPVERRVRANGIELTCYEWGAHRRNRGPTILLAHATGFHARCWDPVVARLGDVHVVAVDQRGHGRSERTPITHWRVFGEDLADLVRALDLRDVLGVGHSMGGHALVDAAAAEPGRFRGLVLVDPVIASPDEYGTGGWTIQRPGDEPHPVARRRRRFDSPEAMIARFRDRPPYDAFVPEALEAYCRWGLLAAQDGAGFELACPPETEASIYMTSRTNVGVHDSVRRLALPVLVLRARRPPPDREVMDFSSSPTWPGLAGALRRGREIHYPDRSHFLPMEVPDEIAARILEALAGDEGAGPTP
jgi:pimeloyl-ACP methyl ester carboxylesterase